MTKKDYIRAADMVRRGYPPEIRGELVSFLTEFFAEDNPRFGPNIFLGYINGTCGPSGGAITSRKSEVKP